jgi:hypothetical protein
MIVRVVFRGREEIGELIELRQEENSLPLYGTVGGFLTFYRIDWHNSLTNAGCKTEELI